MSAAPPHPPCAPGPVPGRGTRARRRRAATLAAFASLAFFALPTAPVAAQAGAVPAIAASAPPTPPAPAGVASPALPERGRVATARMRHVRVDGLDRDYLVQAEPGARGAGRLPVIVVLHGGTETAQEAWRETSLPTLGAREGFLVVAPEALNRHWNDARGAGVAGEPASTVDDVHFLKAVIADVIAQDHGDPSAVFMVGISNGGFMAMRFACDAGETLRAAASVLATMPEALARNCKSPRPLPWLAINGTEDPLIPFGGQVEGIVRRGEAQPALESVDDTFRFWADRAGCATVITRQPLTDAAADERHRWAERVERGGCVAGQVSGLVVLHGSGHVVPGQPVESRLIERVVGPAAPELDGGTLIWSHFHATLLK